ncbi:YybH family protein [Streptomyces otsuchiensis]|uniref:YybH family protein n=1 Tax=Streptomyces otsuchiensis TaxID=2681388 RepID=UPI0010325618|nr:DUF4440 domain-containing protein [Streptomyces otsuchiensis]
MTPQNGQAHQPVTDPHEHTAAFGRAFNSGDLEAVLASQAEGAVFVQEPGKPLSGDDARQAVKDFLALGLPMRIEDRHVYVSDDIALVIADWVVEGTAADGSRLRLAGTSTDVIRRGPDARWRSVIDNPNGTA